MKVHIVCYEDVHGWILGKFALKLQEFLIPLGIAATISKRPDFNADINHHIIYYDYDGVKTTTDTVMVTHIDTDWKREWLLQQLNNAAMGVCMSAENVDTLAAAGLPRKKLCFVNPGHDGLVQPRRIIIGITSKVQLSGCKREGMLLELAKHISPTDFQFSIMGSGWDELVQQLRLIGFIVDYWADFDYIEYQKLMPKLDYFLYLGMDEGSMGFMDALTAGVATIVTTQGYHLDAPGGITHGFTTGAELLYIFESIARDRRLRQQAVADWTWPEYANRHYALWEYLLARNSNQLLDVKRKNTLKKMAVIVDDVDVNSSLCFQNYNQTSRSIQLRPELKLDLSQAESIIDGFGVHPWFKYTLRDRASRWESWQTCFWITEHIPKELAIFDIGCGIGLNLFWLYEQGYRMLYGQDGNPVNVAAAVELSKLYEHSVLFWTDNALQPSGVPSQQCACICAMNFMHCVEGDFSLVQFLKTYSPYLQSGGVFIFDVVDVFYNYVLDNQYHTADMALLPDHRRPSEYINRMGRSDVQAACDALGWTICHTISQPQLVPKIIYFLKA